MGSPGDYTDDMDRPDSRLIEAALRGRSTGDPALDRAAQLVADVRLALLEDPGPEVAARHLTAMAVAARAGGESGAVPARGRPGGRRRIAGLALAATLILGAGVATAITLPDRASDRAEEAVAEAPGRGGSESEPVPIETSEASAHGQEVSELARDDSLPGCEKGQALSDLASSNADGHRNDDPERNDPCAMGQGGGSAGGGDRGEEASGHGRTTGQEARAKDHGASSDPGRPTDGPGSGQGSPAGGGRPDQPGS
jgi:hypothetical protein